MEVGAGMAYFKFLKYESRNEEEKRQINDDVMTKLGNWKYSTDKLPHQIPNELLQEIKPKWENAQKIVGYN